MTASSKSRYHDISGLTFGRLYVVKLSHIKKRAFWLCKCECGKETVVPLDSLRNGNTKSCGCLVSDTNSTHRLTRTPTWVSWFGMRHRCKNKNVHNYDQYGGKGISVCERWQSFENFLLDMGERPAGTSLDRIDPKGNYEPSNCRWATQQEQNCNKLTTKMFTYKGETMPLALLCKKHNVDYQRVLQRINKQKWTVEKAIEQPVDTTRISKTRYGTRH